MKTDLLSRGINSRITALALILAFLLPTFAAVPTAAQSCDPVPPFWLDLTPSYRDGQITYRLGFYSRVDWEMLDLEIKIPLPEGTRFVRAWSWPDTPATFNGVDVTFRNLKIGPYGYIEDAYFVVEPVSAEQTVFTVQPWVQWRGDHAGAYQPDPESFSISPPPPDWTPPPKPHLRVNAAASVTGNSLVYTLSAYNAHNWNRLENVQVNLPTPAGTRLVSLESAPPFTGLNLVQEASFRAPEFLSGATATLTATFSLADDTPFPVVTRVWTAWDNPDTSSDLPHQSWLLDNLTVDSRLPRQILFDPPGDVPSPATDILAAEMSFRGDALYLSLTTREPAIPTPESSPVISFYFDRDLQDYEYDECNPNAPTFNQERNFFGPELLVEVDLRQNTYRIFRWNAEYEGLADESDALYLGADRVGNRVSVRVPREFLPLRPPFRWWAETFYRQNWPVDSVFDEQVPHLFTD